MAENFSPQEALAIVAACPFPLLVLDRHRQVSGYNQAFEQLVGAQCLAELRDPEASHKHPVQGLLTGDNVVCWTDQNKQQRHFMVHRVALTATDGAEARFFADITAQVKLEHARNALSKELEEHILTDPVTGLLNRRGIMLALEPQVARSRRYDSPIAVIALDASDTDEETQRAIAQLLKDQLRWADLVGFTERREFVMALPETTTDAAVGLAEKISRQIEAIAPKTGSRAYGVTAWRKNDNANALLTRAATALTRARCAQGPQLIAL